MLLEVKNVFKSFGDKEVLKDISFKVESGKAMGFLGRNGSGKTTTIRCIMDIFKPNSGEIFLDGKKFDPKKNMVRLSPRMETSRVRLRTAQKKAAQSMSRLVALVKSIKASIWTKSRARKAGRRQGLMPD